MCGSGVRVSKQKQLRYAVQVSCTLQASVVLRTVHDVICFTNHDTASLKCVNLYYQIDVIVQLYSTFP